MKNEVYCSTGTVIGRKTNNDHSVLLTQLPEICRATGMDGIEYVVMSAAYGMLDDIKRSMSASGLRCAVLHADKNIGVLLSQLGEDNAWEAMRLWQVNCLLAKDFGTDRVVLHLWGAGESDTHFEHNASFMPEIMDIAEKHGIKVLIENIPCIEKDPLTRLTELSHYDCDFVYDVRFGQLHGQNYKTATGDLMKAKRFRHVHISDFGGRYREFSKIRPIYHPYEGTVDFDMVFSELRRSGYDGSFTLESPVFYDDGLDFDKLARTLTWLRRKADELSANGND